MERYARPEQKARADSWYTRLVPAAAEPLMELRRNAEFLRGLGLPSFRSGLPELPVRAKAPAGIPAPYYVLFPGAGVGNRQWPVQHFRELAERIHLATGWTGIVCGGPGEEALGKELAAVSTAPLQDRTGATSLGELVAVIAEAALLVANETSAVHIAAAVGTPSVCVVGGGHFGRFVPYQVEKAVTGPVPMAVYREMPCFGCNWRCPHCRDLHQVAPCIAAVSTDDVWGAVSKIIRVEGDATDLRKEGAL